MALFCRENNKNQRIYFFFFDTMRVRTIAITKRGNLITLSFSYQVFFFQDDHSLILWWLRAWGRLFMGAILCLLLNPKFFGTSAPAYEPPFFQKDFVKRPKFFLRFSLVVARNFVCEFPEHWWKEERHARRCQSVGSFRLFSSFS